MSARRPDEGAGPSTTEDIANCIWKGDYAEMRLSINVDGGIPTFALRGVITAASWVDSMRAMYAKLQGVETKSYIIDCSGAVITLEEDEWVPAAHAIDGRTRPYVAGAILVQDKAWSGVRGGYVWEMACGCVELTRCGTRQEAITFARHIQTTRSRY